MFLFAEIFIQALADGATAIRAGFFRTCRCPAMVRLGRGCNGAVVQGTAGEAAADPYCLRGFFAGRKKSDGHVGGAQS